MARRYSDAAAKLQKSVQKHLQIIKDFSSSEDDEPYEENVLEGMFQNYCKGGGDRLMLDRTNNLLEEASSGKSVTCLICIGSIKRADAIWTCNNCFSYFHLSCIQKWGTDSISLQNEEMQGPIALFKQKRIEWCCPKCRHSYNKEQIPRKYRCFCGKTDDPPFHLWLLPHTCGDVCGKILSNGNNCKHKCLLLCHPGPCPPCPQTVNGVCFCGKDRKKIRCSAPKWACGQQCKKMLQCNSHNCENICHQGECPPCNYTSLQSCQCGSNVSNRPCNDLIWHCTKTCGKQFACGYHVCEKICHPGGCGDCPISGVKLCPCGGNERYIECPDRMDTCLSTCGKKQNNCEHTCPEKCHRGACPPCQVLIEKMCYCSTHTRSLPCSKDFRCETKCRGVRACRKHVCGRKCCGGNCPPCEKICDKPLQCGRHKCASICHLGPCYPCSRESKITCRCKETYLTLPCGRDRHSKPPKCTLLCKIKYKCGHSNENKHNCHFGDCPPCKATCNRRYDKCEHACTATCHEYVVVTFKQVEKPATPWEAQPPKTKIVKLDCPPCEAPVLITCFGEHETEYMPCHVAIRGPCGRPCGRPLSCGNHNCSQMCHLCHADSDYPNVPYVCKPCDKECLKNRTKECSHTCPNGVCHPGACPPCIVLVKKPCHCGTTQVYLRCFELATDTEDISNCQQQCPKLLICGHRCKRLCHSGKCEENQVCTRKTKIYCPCGNLKKDVPCNCVKESELLLICNELCESKKIAAKIEKENKERRLKELEDEKNRKELAEYEWKLSGKKKKYKDKKVMIQQRNDNSWLQKFWIPILIVFISIAAVTYYTYYDT